MSSAANRLSYNEEIILALYPLMYNRPYNCKPDLTSGEPNRFHINAQKASYIFSQMRVPAGDYGFSWNHHGPYSEALQGDLRILDSKVDLVAKYYESNSDAYKRLEVLYSPLQRKRAMQTARELNSITLLSPDGGELVGSLLYISQSVRPGFGFEVVNEELKRRKRHFSDDIVNKQAWEKLQNLKLVPV